MKIKLVFLLSVLVSPALVFASNYQRFVDNNGVVYIYKDPFEDYGTKKIENHERSQTEFHQYVDKQGVVYISSNLLPEIERQIEDRKTALREKSQQPHLEKMAYAQTRSIPPQSAVKEEHKSAPAIETKDYSLDNIIKSIANKHGVPRSLVKAVIKAESGFDPNAVSPKGATGLMQLMPGTASDLGVNDVYDPEENIDGGTRYLKQQLNEFGNYELALAAYNAGPEAVRNYGNQIHPYSETRTFVKRVLRNYETYQD